MAQSKCVQSVTKWPNPSEYTDRYILPALMPSKPDPWSSVEGNIDMLTCRPRTPNDQYTVLNAQQLKNLKKDPSPFFSNECMSGTKRKLPNPIMKRFAYDTSQHLFRDTPPRYGPHCWIGEKWQRQPPEQHNASRLGSSLLWGPSKTGTKTISHFHNEEVYSYLNIDVYKRPPTNIPSMVVMKYGRPSNGYYQQRNPNFNTWFGSTHKLNETNILTNIQPKTFAEYEEFKTMQQNYERHQSSKWSSVSEYTDRFLLQTKEVMKTDKLEETKQFYRERRRREAEAFLKSQSEKTQAQPPTVANEPHCEKTQAQPLTVANEPQTGMTQALPAASKEPIPA